MDPMDWTTRGQKKAGQILRERRQRMGVPVAQVAEVSAGVWTVDAVNQLEEAAEVHPADYIRYARCLTRLQRRQLSAGTGVRLAGGGVQAQAVREEALADYQAQAMAAHNAHQLVVEAAQQVYQDAVRPAEEAYMRSMAQARENYTARLAEADAITDTEEQNQ